MEFSPYLTRLLHAHAALFPDNTDATAIDYSPIMETLLLQAKKTNTVSQEACMQDLRLLKQQIALVTALADLTHSWSMEEATRHLSAFADIATEKAFLCATEPLVKSGILASSHEGMAVYAVGKLGSNELNYSSDIDIIFFYNPDSITYHGRLSLSQQMVNVVQHMHHTLSQLTKEGYVFRVDLRLRPDPGSTQSAISLPFAQHYYASVGQNWERAAMTKARFICGCNALESEIHTMLEQFMWRQELDYTAQQDILAIQGQIAHRKKKRRADFAGYHIKLGHGGIRDIEFLLQIQQLLWGGRDRNLRVLGTKPVLEALEQAGLLPQHHAAALWQAYVFYRNLEHRLQMVQDQQTHSLPKNEAALQQLAGTLRLESIEALSATLTQHIEAVETAYSEVLQEDAASLALHDAEHSGNLVFTGVEDDPETLRTLTDMGYDNPAFVSQTIRGWHHGRIGSTQSAEARAMLTALMPLLLQAFADTLKPDTAFKHFNEFLNNTPEEARIFHLLHAKPDILPLLATSFGHFPYMARYLINSPHVVDELVSAAHADLLDTAPQPHTEEDTALPSLESITWEARNNRFDVALARVRDTISFADISQALTHVADATLRAAMQHIAEEMAPKYGTIKGGAFAIIGMGKLGAEELTFGSDLDMIYVYDAPKNATSKGGEKSLGAAEYYIKYAQLLNGFLSSATNLGALYDVDLRLRPNGEKGNLATHYDSLLRYYTDGAWAWEHMALTRARIIDGEAGLCEKLSSWLQATQSEIFTRKALNWKLLEIHTKTQQQFHSNDPLNVKYVPGGLLDVEYILQSCLLCLPHNPHTPGNQFSTQLRYITEQQMITQTEADTLQHAHLLYNEIITSLRLMGISTRENKPQNRKFYTVLVSQLPDYKTKDALHKALVLLQKNVQTIFTRLFTEETIS